MKNSIQCFSIRWSTPVPSARHLIHLSCPSIIVLAWTYQLRSRIQAKLIVGHQSCYFARFVPLCSSCERQPALWSASIACERPQSTCASLPEHFCLAPALPSSSDTSPNPRASYWIRIPFPPSKVYSKSNRSQSGGQLVIKYCPKCLPLFLRSSAKSNSSSSHQVAKIALPCSRPLVWHRVRRSSRLFRVESCLQLVIAFGFDPLSTSLARWSATTYLEARLIAFRCSSGGRALHFSYCCASRSWSDLKVAYAFRTATWPVNPDQFFVAQRKHWLSYRGMVFASASLSAN